MSRWADKAVDEIEGQLERGEIDYQEYKDELRSIRDELREEAENEAYDGYMSY